MFVLILPPMLLGEKETITVRLREWFKRKYCLWLIATMFKR